MDKAAVELLRKEFPWLGAGEHIYLNAASDGALPARTVAASCEVLALRGEPWKVTGDRVFGVLGRVRESCARLIGATANEIGLMPNTGSGLNLAAHALPMRSGDVVLIPDGEFPSNAYPWLAIERTRGVRVHRVPRVDGLPDEEGLLRAIDEIPNVRVVSVSWVSFDTGVRFDLASIGAACRARGIAFVVDAIQGLGVAPLDVRECQIDVLACAGHKWLLSPWGTGFVYVRSALVPTMEPPMVGWLALRSSDDFTRLTAYDLTYRDDARRFESVMSPAQNFAGMEASLALLCELGVDRVARHVSALATRMIDGLADHPDIRLLTPRDAARRAGIVAFVPHDVPAVSARLTKRGVIHAVREGAIRLAPHVYNTESEIDQVLAVLG